jgi:hypothetical protein
MPVAALTHHPNPFILPANGVKNTLKNIQLDYPHLAASIQKEQTGCADCTGEKVVKTGSMGHLASCMA